MKCAEGKHSAIVEVDHTTTAFLVKRCLICGVELAREAVPWADLLKPRGILEVDWAKGDSQIVTAIEGSDGQGR
jgi:hypothetical protein